MKPFDVTKSVMDQVTRFEERRTRVWITVFAVISAVILALIGFSLFRAYAILSERHTWDLLEIFSQDREIIAEFWQDTVSVAIEELPVNSILVGSMFGILFAGVWIFTARRRRIVKRRLTELAKRQKTRNNSGRRDIV